VALSVTVVSNHNKRYSHERHRQSGASGVLGQLVRPVQGHGAHADEHIMVDLTRKQIEDSPPLASDKPVSLQFELDYHGYFGWAPYWVGPFAWGHYPIPMHAGNREANSNVPESSPGTTKPRCTNITIRKGIGPKEKSVQRRRGKTCKLTRHFEIREQAMKRSLTRP
jgi:hypothetical protein